MITVRSLDAAAKRRIERRAAAHGRSMEAEARAILEAAEEPDDEVGVLAAIRAARAVLGDEQFELPERIVEYAREFEAP